MNKSTIALINQVAGPLFIDIANEYVKKYKNVHLITGNIESTYSELDKNISVTFNIAYNRNKKFNRIFTWLFFYIQTVIHLIFKGHKYDKILLVTNPPILPFIGSSLLPIMKIKFDVLIYDVFPDALSNFGYIKSNSIFFKIWDRINKKSYDKAQRIITISNVMKDLISRNVEKQKIEIIYPWVDTSFIKPVKREHNWFIRKHGLTGKKIILYSGNMGETHDLITPLKAAEKIYDSNPEFQFLFIGDGVRKNEMLQYVLEKQIKNVSFLPFQNSSVLPFSFASAHFGIVSLAEGAKGLSVPSKTFYFLSAGTPLIVISEKGSEIDNLISENECGICCNPGDFQKIVDFLQTDSDILHQKFKQNARKLSLKFKKSNVKKF